MTYTFKCKECGKDFEKEMTFADYDKYKTGEVPVLCECGKESERTFIMDTLVTHYKCGGFYDTESKTGSFRVR